MMEIAHPRFLILLLVVPLLVLTMRRSLADMTPSQRAVCFALRSLILSLLALALAGIWLRLPADDLAVLFLVDDSASISDAAKKQAHDFIAESLKKIHANDEAGVLGFAGETAVWQAPSSNLKLAEKFPPTAARDSTEIGGVLTFASAIFSPEKSKRIILLSDGNDTGEGALEKARSLAARDVEVFVVPLKNDTKPEVLIEKNEMPNRLKAGEPFNAIVKIRSNVETTATVKLYQNGFLAGSKNIALKKGAQEIPFQNLKAEQGQSVLCEAEIVPAQDTLRENNRAQAISTIRGEPLVLVVDGEPSKIQPLANALRQEKIKVEVRGANGLPRTLEDLQQFDLFILSGVSALNLSREQMELYRMWVRDFGGGFAMLGGENSFGVGGYYKTTVEQMLPVRMEHEDRQDTPSVALLVSLDRSGSMASQVQGQTKISLADQGAVLAMNVLKAKDLFGVTAVDTRVHNVVPIARLDNKPAAEQKIMGITSAGGGIYIYTSLADAYQQIRDVNAKIKHVIFFSDAADVEEKTAGEVQDGAGGAGSSLDLAATMVANKISVSVVGLGNENDKDVDFLKQLAERGSGRFYLTNDALSLPQIFATETIKVAQSSLVEEPFAAVQVAQNAITAGIDWKQSPLLLGYNATKPKPTADLLLATERGEPLLATWRYGLGQAAAFTSDAKSRWASEWLSWPGYGKFWAQFVRGMMSRGEHSTFQITTHESGDRLTLKIDAVSPDGNFLNQLPLTIRNASSGGASKSVDAQQDAPGSYTAAFDLPREGASIFSVSSPQIPGGETFLGYTRSYPAEFLTTETNGPFLRQLAEAGGGKFAPSFDDIFSRPKQKTIRRLDLTDYFLSLALLLFPLDIWLRRRTWK